MTSEVRPAARQAATTTSASPRVRFGVRPVNRNRQQPAIPVQFRTTGRDDNSAYTARTSWISSGSDFAFTGSRAHDALSRKNHNRKNNLDSFSPPRLQARQAGED